MAGHCASGVVVAAGVVLLMTAIPVSGQVRHDILRLSRVRQVAEGFTRVTAVVPTGDDELLVVDAGDASLWRVNLSSSAMERFSRSGEGPGEYRSPGRAFAVSPDSTFVFDDAQKRLTLLGRKLSFRSTHTVARIASFRLRGLDQNGNVYYEEAPEGFQPATFSALHSGRRPKIRNMDSVPIIRFAISSGTVDTSGWVQLPPRRTERQSAVSEAPGAFGDRLPFGEQDDWSVSPSGLIAIVRGHDYSVTWLRGGQEVGKSTSITKRRVPVTEEEKEAYWSAIRTDSLSLLNCSQRPCRVTQVFRPQRPNEWPEFKNPFEPRRLVFDRRERLWIRRAGQVGDALVLYDVVGRDGFLATVGLDAGQTVLGVVSQGVVTVREDSDGLQYLDLYSLPRF